MSSGYLLDTNAAIALLKDNLAITSLLSNANVYASVISIGELYFGAEKSVRRDVNLEKVDQFAKRFSIIQCEVDTARVYGVVQHSQRLKGRPIPHNDLWIAATAMQHGLTLLTRDAHFNEVDGLALAAW